MTINETLCNFFSSLSFTLLFKCDYNICSYLLGSASGNCSLETNIIKMKWKGRELNVSSDYTRTQIHRQTL